LSIERDGRAIYDIWVGRVQEHRAPKLQSSGFVGFLRAARVAERAAEEEFDLAVEAAKVVVGPALYRLKGFAVYA
jgi:hypothetical protein